MIEKHIVILNVEASNIILYLVSNLGLSTRRVKQLLKNKKIKINDKFAYRDSKLHDRDIIYIDLEEKENSEIEGQDIPIDIIFEDNYLLALNKPPFMLMHPTSNHKEGTLANALKYYFNERGDNYPVRFLNRLDMNTSGVVLVPKSSETHRLLSEEMLKNNIEKTYIAVVEGKLTKEDGVIDKPIGKDEENPIKRKIIHNGQKALTKYRVIEYFNGVSLLELCILTGRTHQIRVHLSHMGYPIIGDELYGKKSSLINRQALHAFKLQLNHPCDTKRLSLEAPIPKDMKDLINFYRMNSKI